MKGGVIIENLLGILMLLVFWSPVIAYVLLQLYGVVKLDRWWRGAAALPLLLMVPIIVNTVKAFKEKSNLAPIFLIIASPVAAVYLLVLTIVGRAARRHKTAEPSRQEQL